MATIYGIPELRARIAPIAKQFGVDRVYAFGSYGREEAGQDSDLDLRIDKGEIQTLFQLTEFRLTLEDALSIPVDIVTSDMRDCRFLSSIAKDEVLLYEKQ